MNNPQQFQPNEPPREPEATVPPKKTSGIILVLILIFLSFTGYFVSAKFLNVWPFELNDIVVVPTPTQRPDLAKGWKEYINEAWGYSLRYPPGFIVDVHSEVTQISSSQNFPSFRLFLETKPYDISLSTWISDGISLLTPWCEKENLISKKIGRHNTHQCEFDLNEHGVISKSVDTVFFSPSKDFILKIKSGLPLEITDQERNDYQKILEEMIKSIDFSSESTYQFNEWNRYSNEEWGVEILYSPFDEVKPDGNGVHFVGIVVGYSC